MTRRILAMVVLTGGVTLPLSAQQNPLAAARELYASARYDEALAVLNELKPNENSSADLKAVEQYRSLCLLALGRGSEAEAAIAAVVTADPGYQPSEAEASPRVRSAFREVRQRLLPDIARSRYATAKATFDRKDYEQAEAQFRALLALLDDPDMGGRLGDLRVLVSGFVDLSAAALTPAPEPKRADPPPPAPTVTPAPAPAQESVMRIYTGEDTNVKAPVAIRQELPRVPGAITSQTRDRGLLELVIDEQGRVMSMALRVSLHPVYDSLVLAAARDWRYQPATLNGKPVKFRKMIQISVTKS